MCISQTSWYIKEGILCLGKHQESEEKFRVDGMEVGKRGKERIPPVSPKGVQPCQHLYFTLLASTAVR